MSPCLQQAWLTFSDAHLRGATLIFTKAPRLLSCRRLRLALLLTAAAAAAAVLLSLLLLSGMNRPLLALGS